MLEYRFCPLCGSELLEMQLETEHQPRLVCKGCGHILYINPRVVSGTLPVQDRRVWLLRRGIEPRAVSRTYTLCSSSLLPGAG